MDRHVEDKMAIITSQVYKYDYIHPEECSNKKINTSIDQGFIDIENIDNNLKTLANNTNELLNKTMKRLNVAKDKIVSEKERLQDLAMLCNANTDFDNVAPLNNDDFEGEFEYEDGVFYSKLKNSSKVKLSIEDVTGNGYEGNKYVFNEGKYLINTLDSSYKNAMLDNNISSYWEYSRITASNNEPYIISDFHTDASEAKTTLTLKFATPANEVAIQTDLKTIKIIGIRYSNDNIKYEDVKMMPFIINNRDESYKQENYIYGSNIISFPTSKYIKITFESIGYTNDTLAFDRTIVNENTDKIEKISTVVQTAKRHVIRINNLDVKSKNYSLNSKFKTKQLITKDSEVYSIALFCNTYFPETIKKDSIDFVLTVNGIDYKVKPINTHEDGIKIIRFSQGKSPVEYTKYIGEKIQSAYLTINMKSKNNLTPYINNIKILLGGEI